MDVPSLLEGEPRLLKIGTQLSEKGLSLDLPVVKPSKGNIPDLPIAMLGISNSKYSSKNNWYHRSSE